MQAGAGGVFFWSVLPSGAAYFWLGGSPPRVEEKVCGCIYGYQNGAEEKKKGTQFTVGFEEEQLQSYSFGAEFRCACEPNIFPMQKKGQ